MNNIDMDLFRQRLKSRCKELKLTYGQLAEKAGISKSSIEKWLYGKDNDFSTNKDYIPSLNMIYKVSQVLGVSLDYFVNPNMNCLTVTNQMISDHTGLSDEAIQNLKILRVFGVHSYAQTINFLLKKNHITLDPPQLSQKDDKGLLSLLASYFVMEPDIKVEGITDNAITEKGADGKRIILNGSDLIGGALFNLIQEKVIEYRSEINNTRKQK